MDHQFDFINSVGIPYFNFVVFIGLFVLFFRKTLSSMARSRREQYLSASKEAAATLERARAGFDDAKKRFDSLELELQAFKQQSEQAALQETTRLLEDTERFTKQLKEETNRLAGEAVAAARQQLRHEMVLAAKNIVEDRIRADMDAATKDKILKARITAASALTVQ